METKIYNQVNKLQRPKALCDYELVEVASRKNVANYKVLFVSKSRCLAVSSKPKVGGLFSYHPDPENFSVHVYDNIYKLYFGTAVQ